MRRIAMLVALLALVAQARAEGLYDRLFEPRTIPIGEVIGMKVLTPDGRPLGTIRDVLFDRNTGIVQSIAVDGSGTTYPVSALLSSDAPGTVIVEPPLEFSSGGPSALLTPPPKPLSSANSAGLVIDLRAGRVRPQ